MSKITLNNVGSLIDATTAQTTINANSAVIQTAMDNTLSRDGTSPNTMGSNFDMNSYQILNLPTPATADSPLRLQDLSSFLGSGIVSNIPAGGTTGQVLDKTSNTDFAVGWTNSVTSVGLALPADLTVTNSPVTTTGTLTGAWATTPTGTGAMVRATSPALVTPDLGTPTAGVATNLTGTAAGLTAGHVTTNANLTGPITSVGNATSVAAQTGTGSTFVMNTSPVLVTPALGTPTSGTLTNTTGFPTANLAGLGTGVAAFLATPSSANLATALTDETGSGAAVFGTSPTLVTPALGTPTSVVLTNGTGLPLSGHTNQAAFTFVGNNTGSPAAPTAVDMATLTAKASPAATDLVILSDQAASGAWKKATISSIASAGSVSSIAGNTGAFTLSQGLTNVVNDLRMDASYLQGYLSGLTISNAAATTVGITTGVAADSTNASMMKLSSAYTKTFAVWALGTAAGGLDTGAIATNTWYHVFLIMRSDTGVVDALISLSATAPTMPTNYDRKRRIGSVKTDATPNIIAFNQNFDMFTWSVPVQDLALGNPTSGSRQLATLSVPTGVIVEPTCQWGGDNTTANFNAMITSPAMADTGPTSTFNSFRIAGTGTNTWVGSNIRVCTNTSAQLGYRVDATGASNKILATTYGWRDFLGK